MIERVEHVMGMPVRAVVRDLAAPRAADGAASRDVARHAAGIRAALDDAFAWLRWVDATFSTYDSRSEISRWGRGELAPRDAHPLVREVLARCEELRAATGGAFDIRFRRGAPPVPSGYVKGWAVVRAGALLAAAGARDFCLDAGGDVLVRGGPWRIGIRHPRHRHLLAGVLVLHDGAVATSGAYERGPHILDPRTGRPAAGVLSVTVVGPDLGVADAYATAAFVAGPELTTRLEGYDAMTVVRGDRVLKTAGFPRDGLHGDVEGSGSSCGRGPATCTLTAIIDVDVQIAREFAEAGRARFLNAAVQNAKRSVTIWRRGTPERASVARVASVIAGDPHT